MLSFSSSPASVKPGSVPHLHFRDAAVRLGQQGYVLAPPPWVSAENLAIDRESAAEGVCGCCGHRGMLAEPFHRAEYGAASYVVLAVCMACLHSEEF